VEARRGEIFEEQQTSLRNSQGNFNNSGDDRLHTNSSIGGIGNIDTPINKQVSHSRIKRNQ
jgi:hypothetical protein